MPYRSGSYTYKIRTPSRKKVIKAVTRKSFHASASTMVQSPRFLQSIIVKIALRIKEEMKKLSSNSHDSVLRDSIEGVRCFHWETVRLELVQNLPTLTMLLSLIQWNLRREDSTGMSHLSSLGRLSSFRGFCFYH